MPDIASVIWILLIDIVIDQTILLFISYKILPTLIFPLSPIQRTIMPKTLLFALLFEVGLLAIISNHFS